MLLIWSGPKLCRVGMGGIAEVKTYKFNSNGQESVE